MSLDLDDIGQPIHTVAEDVFYPGSARPAQCLCFTVLAYLLDYLFLVIGILLVNICHAHTSV